MLPEVEKQGKSDIRRARKGTHKYNTRLRVNHVTTFNNTPKMFKMDTADTSKTHIGSYYIAHTESKKDTIAVEPLANHINCETTGKILEYRDLVNMDASVWANSMCNELGRLSQGWKEHAGTDTIELIFHKDKPKDRRATCVRSVCNIRTQKTEAHRKSLTVGRNVIDFPGEEQHTNIRLDHHETPCKQRHLRNKIEIHVHGRERFLTQQQD